MEIYGIYNADGGIIGELKYVLGKIIGIAHCSLCDITHSYISKKKTWKAFEERGDFKINLLHINEQESGLREFTHDITPCVVAKEGNEVRILLTSEQLEKCNKSVGRFEEALTESLKSS